MKRLLFLVALPVCAHRLDEYLQATLISLDHDHFTAELTLSPGVAVVSQVLREIDLDGDGEISTGEQHRYATKVLSDLTLSVDGRAVAPEILSATFAPLSELRDGTGAIRIHLRANLPPGGSLRKLVIENHHQSAIAAYQVNALVPRDPALRILAQKRNYTQSSYEVEYGETTGTSNRTAAIGMMLFASAAWLGRIRLKSATSHRASHRTAPVAVHSAALYADNRFDEQ